jgi:uncharacterized protein YwbE
MAEYRDVRGGIFGAIIFLAQSGPVRRMSGERPTEASLRRGMTVEIEQTNTDNADDADSLRGEIRSIIDEGESPQGVTVKLDTGVTGYVRRVVND